MKLADIVVEKFDQDILKHCMMPVFTVYEKTSDYPDKFVVRLFNINKATNFVAVKDTLEEARTVIPVGRVKFPKDEKDDPCIVEIYL